MCSGCVLSSGRFYEYCPTPGKGGISPLAWRTLYLSLWSPLSGEADRASPADAATDGWRPLLLPKTSSTGCELHQPSEAGPQAHPRAQSLLLKRQHKIQKMKIPRNHSPNTDVLMGVRQSAGGGREHCPKEAATGSWRTENTLTCFGYKAQTHVPNTDIQR